MSDWIEKVYDDIAETYDEFCASFDPENVIPKAVHSRFDLSRQRRFLDIGIGTGYVDAWIVRHAPFAIHVTGIDVSRNMLDKARDNLDAAGLTKTSVLELCDVQEYPFDEKFDGVIMTSTIRLLANKRDILARCRNALRPGGAVVIQDIRMDEPHGSGNSRILSEVYPEIETKHQIVGHLEAVGFRHVACVEFEIRPRSFDLFVWVRSKIIAHAEPERQQRIKALIQDHKAGPGAPRMAKFFIASARR